ncbi:hypothetical protein CPAR01_03210 [Colletotrichum paranaense]|uniref:Secreted protein n=1 Tax=Colletotrichum paranaense TaxID=1914294 RepID=A0ABQ9T1T5_9PEZI|nr:uncharacterized protein CPAR01_03210 [Colletotrichum paranaense]KAK1545708.1 hypothetical protein CPAR01_03210 [Colletotrichum paranaense]
MKPSLDLSVSASASATRCLKALCLCLRPSILFSVLAASVNRCSAFWACSAASWYKVRHVCDTSRPGAAAETLEKKQCGIVQTIVWQKKSPTSGSWSVDCPSPSRPAAVILDNSPAATVEEMRFVADTW